MKPYDYKWTKFYEANCDFLFTGLELDLAENELIICSTIIDKDNFSILTTRQLLTQQDGKLSSGNIHDATHKQYGDFKGYEDKDVTFGTVHLQNGLELNYFIETGKASMIMIQGVKTLLQVNSMTATQVDNIGRAWNNRLNKINSR